VIGTVVREVLAELLPDVLTGGAARNGTPPGRAAPAPAATPPAVPRVPAPPVARVHRPSQRVADAVPQAAAPAPATPRPTPAPAAAPAPAPAAVAASPPAARHDGVHEVTIDSQADLDAFVRDLVRRLESPRDRLAIRAGKLRFALRRPTVGSDGRPPAMRIERGAVTERVVAEAAAARSRLVLGPKAVLTPMGRDRARTLGVEIEKERQC
jgi:hypothetical protein